MTNQVSEASLQTVIEGQPGRNQWVQTFRERRRTILGAAGMAFFLSVWEVAGTSGILDPMFTSAPSLVAKAFMKQLASGAIWKDLGISFVEYLIGGGLASVVGILMGLLMGWYRPVYAMFNPFVSGLYATPRISLISLIIIWFGIGLWSKVAVVFLGSVFPILINVIAGVQTADYHLLQMARSFGGNKNGKVFLTIVVPSSVPYILAGLRIGWGHGLVGVVVAEMYASTAGVGHMIFNAGATFQTDVVFVGVAITAATGIAVMQMIGALERKVERWKPQAPSRN